MAIHYTTHLALAAYKRCDGKISELFQGAPGIALAKKYGKTVNSLCRTNKVRAGDISDSTSTLEGVHFLII